MGREVVLFKSEEKKSSSEIAAVLRQMADRIEQGTMTLGRNENRVTLDFPENMILEIKVEEEENAHIKRSLEIELEWMPDGEGQDSLIID